MNCSASRWRRTAGFTLIEMLVVLAIIGVLSGLLLTALQSSRTQARKTRARSDVDQLTAAWLQYLHEYRCFPKSAPITTMDGNAIAILRGTTAHVDNRRSLFFMDFNTNTLAFLDPWNNVYEVRLDDNYDNKVKGPDNNDVFVNVAIWSRGPDGVANTRDDILSWQK